jgi:GNAT superfamily N-acetyltransferase
MIVDAADQNRGATAMIDDWFSAIDLPITWQQFWQLPRNPAYKYEYFDGRGWLSPRPKSGQAVLELQDFARPIAEMATPEKLLVRPLQNADWQQLPELFAAAFHRVQPFASLTDEDRETAAKECLTQTRQGDEGPLIGEACFAAAGVADDTLIGANLVTLPPRKMAEHAGLPHLTWIFVAPLFARQGVGMALLDATVQALLQRGDTALASTFLIGNESTMLWHWRAGFKLAEERWSIRAARLEARANQSMPQPACDDHGPPTGTSSSISS